MNTYLSQEMFCRDKNMFVATKVLSWQAYFYHDKRRGFFVVVATKLLLWQIFNTCFVVTSMLLSQQKKCCVITNTYLSQEMFCRDKNMFVATKVLSWQAYFYHDKRCGFFVVVATKLLLWQIFNTCFVVTSMLLSQQKKCCVITNTYLSQEMFCRDKNMFVSTKQQKFCRDKHTFIMTKDRCFLLLLWQNFCHDKNDTCGSFRQWDCIAVWSQSIFS